MEPFCYLIILWFSFFVASTKSEHTHAEMLQTYFMCMCMCVCVCIWVYLNLWKVGWNNQFEMSFHSDCRYFILGQTLFPLPWSRPNDLTWLGQTVFECDKYLGALFVVFKHSEQVLIFNCCMCLSNRDPFGIYYIYVNNFFITNVFPLIIQIFL